MKKITAEKVKKFIVKRKKNSHKNDFGKLLIIAGSKGMTGAAFLSAKAALKAGAGLVIAACPSSERKIVAASLPEAMTFDGGGKNGFFSRKSADKILAFAKKGKFDLVLIGPGLSVEKGVSDFVLKILKNINLPLLIDADALNALAEKGIEKVFPLPPPAIMTPHLGEMRRLLKTDSSNRKKLAESLNEKTGGAAVVMKGHNTFVAGAGEIFENTTGGPELSKGGSGDVLSGIIAGIWAQFKTSGLNEKNAFESCLLGVYVHGLCGEMAADKYTQRCVLAGDLIDFIPAAYRRVIARQFRFTGEKI